MKSIRILARSATLAAALTATQLSAQEQVGLGTSSSGSGPYLTGASIVTAVNKAQDDFKFNAQTTGGYKDNIGLVLAGNVGLGMTSLIDLEAAYFARGPFAEVGGAEAFKDLRKVFVYGVDPVNLFVRADSGIETPADIRGKKININTQSSFTYSLNLDLIEALDMTTDDFKPGNVSTSQVFSEVKNRVFDGGLHIFPVGQSGAQELAATTDMKWISFDEQTISRMNKVYFGLLPDFTIPAGTYAGQDSEVKTFGTAQVLFAHKDTDPEMVYAFTKAFWESLEELKAKNATFTNLKLATSVADTGVPFHPGAIQFFKEKGFK